MITLSEPAELMVILLVTDRCQLRCTYCELDPAAQDMPEGLVAQVMEGLHRLVPRERPITFAWHGGEPLLRGLPFYRRVHEAQAELRQTRRVRNHLQTNGLLLDDAFLDFLEETGDFRPNISMDGPDVITRRTRGVGAEVYEALFARLKGRGIPFGISVAGSPDLAEHRDEALAYFRQQGLDNVGVTIFQASRKASRATPALLAELTLGGDPEGRRVNALGRYLLQGIQDQRLRGACRLSSFSDGCHRHVLCVDVQGNLHPCLRGKWSGLWTYGQVQGGGLEAWWASTSGPPPFRPALPEACGPCVWKEDCRGGCPSNAQAMNGGADQPDFYCESFKRLFQAAQEDVVDELCTRAAALSRCGPAPGPLG